MLQREHEKQVKVSEAKWQREKKRAQALEEKIQSMDSKLKQLKVLSLQINQIQSSLV